MRLSALLEIVAIISLVFLAAAPARSAEEKEARRVSEANQHAVPPSSEAPCDSPTLKLAKKATAQTLPTPAAVEDGEADDSCPVDAAATEQPSHRRGAERKKTAGTGPTAGSPLERLEELRGDEVVLQPIIVRSTLADAMRRVALWGDCCPICGHSPSGNKHKPADAHHGGEPLPRQQVLDVEDAKPVQEPAPAPLRAGEPAQVILDTQKRLGKSVTDGTEFGGSPELLIQWIRILDEENRRRQLAMEEADREEPLVPLGDDLSAKPHAQVEALRQASRQLQEAADLLEEQNLFEAADSLRGFADVLRHQSRHKLSQSGHLHEMPIKTR